MRYNSIKKATFLARPNRFIAHAELDGQTVICHVKNTGRCKELLVPGATVYLEDFDGRMGARKTQFDLIAVEKVAAGKNRLINMDAQAPNKVFGEWTLAGHFVPELTLLKPETTFGKSRFDFYWEAGEHRGFVEVKGVTLEVDGAAYFPDAPTQRGVKHLDELIAARQAGYESAVCFVIQMPDIAFFAPNDVTHPAFGDALRRAQAAGVEIMARACAVTPDSLTLTDAVPVQL